MGTMAFVGALPVLRFVWLMDATTAGAIQTAFNLSNALALLVTSWLSDSLGAKRMYQGPHCMGALRLRSASPAEEDAQGPNLRSPGLNVPLPTTGSGIFH
jgi:hypothetical protein